MTAFLFWRMIYHKKGKLFECYSSSRISFFSFLFSILLIGLMFSVLGVANIAGQQPQLIRDRTDDMTPRQRADAAFQTAERLFKDGLFLEAFQAISQATDLIPNERKFSRRQSEYGKVAAPIALKRAQVVLGTEPLAARRLLSIAIEADPSISASKLLLAELELRIDEAESKAEKLKDLLNLGNANDARALISEIEPFREGIPNYTSLKDQLGLLVQINEIQSLMRRGAIDEAVRRLSSSASLAGKNEYNDRLLSNLRRVASGQFVALGESAGCISYVECFKKLDYFTKAVATDPTNQKALGLANELKDTLIGQISNLNQGALGSRNKNELRLALERVMWLRDKMPKYADEIQKFALDIVNQLNPFLNVETSITQPENCNLFLTTSPLEGAILSELSHFSAAQGQSHKVTFSLKRLNCSDVDIPRQNVRQINSTYVASYLQEPNPAYIKLRDELERMDREEADVRNNADTYYKSGRELGKALGALLGGRTIRKVREELRNEPAFISVPVIQQYQYEAYDAYRRAEIETVLEVTVEEGSNRFKDSVVIKIPVERRAPGLSNVLPTDTTSARNTAANLPSLESMFGEAKSIFITKLGKDAQLLISGFFSEVAMDRTRSGEERVAAALFLSDVSVGTSFETLLSKVRYDSDNSPLPTGTGLEEYANTFSFPVSKTADRKGVQSADGSPNTAINIDAVLGSVVTIAVSKSNGNLSTGSGFFVDSRCLLITNAHVVDNGEAIMIGNSMKRVFSAEVVAVDEKRDLALLQADTTSCVPLPLGDSQEAKIGQEVFAFGSPRGLSGTVTKGIVSSMRNDRGIQLIQLDAAINAGNSGGPLVNGNGVVIGVNTFGLKNTEGLNFAVASDEIKKAFSMFLAPTPKF